MNNEALREKMNGQLSEFGFSTRVRNIFEREGIRTVRDLVSRTGEDLYSIRGLGRVSMWDIRERLMLEGLHLGMRWEIEGLEVSERIRTTSPELEVSFLQTLLDTPRDFVTRAVYADWLEERGDGERSGFLRLWDALLLEEEQPHRDTQLDQLNELRREFEADWVRIVEPVALLGNLDVRSANLLSRLRIGSIARLCRVSADELLRGRSFGVSTLEGIRALLRTVGLGLRGDVVVT